MLSGGDLDQIFTNTITGGLNAQITNTLPDILNSGDHGFSFGLMLGHGIVQGAFSAIRGGKFKTGFISGAASKITSATINETPLSQADPFIKMSVTAILSGMASKASGGDFVQGALSAMVVWLYNEMGSFDPLFGAPSDMMQPVYKFFDSLFGEKPPSKFEKGMSNIVNGVSRDAPRAIKKGAIAVHKLLTKDPSSVKGGIISQALFEYTTLKIGANSGGAIGYELVPSENLWITRIYSYTNPLNIDTIYSGYSGELIKIDLKEDYIFKYLEEMKQ